jgi:hypothetical protein
VTLGLPVVRVPVLSKAMAFSVRRFSRWAPPLDEHAAARGTRDAGQHRGRCGDGQRARGRGDQHGHGTVERGSERLAHQQRHHDERDDADENDRDEDLLERRDEALRGGLLGLRLGHHPHHARQRAVPGEPRHLDGQQTLAVHGACEHRGADDLVDGHRFAGDGGLVDGRGAFPHHAVGGDALSRLHEHAIAAQQRLDGHLDLDALA